MARTYAATNEVFLFNLCKYGGLIRFFIRKIIALKEFFGYN